MKTYRIIDKFGIHHTITCTTLSEYKGHLLLKRDTNGTTELVGKFVRGHWTSCIETQDNNDKMEKPTTGVVDVGPLLACMVECGRNANFLDDLVHCLANQTAHQINNSGSDAQLTYLLNFLSVSELDEIIRAGYTNS